MLKLKESNQIQLKTGSYNDYFEINNQKFIFMSLKNKEYFSI